MTALAKTVDAEHGNGTDHLGSKDAKQDVDVHEIERTNTRATDAL